MRIMVFLIYINNNIVELKHWLNKFEHKKISIVINMIRNKHILFFEYFDIFEIFRILVL